MLMHASSTPFTNSLDPPLNTKALEVCGYLVQASAIDCFLLMHMDWPNNYSVCCTTPSNPGSWPWTNQSVPVTVWAIWDFSEWPEYRGGHISGVLIRGSPQY